MWLAVVLAYDSLIDTKSPLPTTGLRAWVFQTLSLSNVDIPRHEAIFGSLLNVFPKLHEGGDRLSQQCRHEWTFYSAAGSTVYSIPPHQPQSVRLPLLERVDYAPM